MIDTAELKKVLEKCGQNPTDKGEPVARILVQAFEKVSRRARKVLCVCVCVCVCKRLRRSGPGAKPMTLREGGSE